LGLSGRASSLDSAEIPLQHRPDGAQETKGDDGPSLARADTEAEAVLHHVLALVMVRHKRTHEAVKELAEATRLDPANARFAYVHAAAHNDAGDPKRVLQVLEAALKRQPNDRDLLSGLALYTAKAGQRDAAIGYAKRLVALDPENPEYAQLVARIEGRKPNQRPGSPRAVVMKLQ
jgi:cytochrome c-type biogenesis protein CcmH/NrfG